MGRFLLALILLTSTNFSVQKMLKDFKQHVNYVMYASLAFFIISLSGCATIDPGGVNSAMLANWGRNINQNLNQQTSTACHGNTTDTGYGSSTTTVTCD